MPTYEYACARCGIIEVFQSMREDALQQCPQCQSKKIERLISGGAGFIFKGDGFWETDYNRSDAYKKQAQEESAAGQKTVDAVDKVADTSSTSDSTAASAPVKPDGQSKPQTQTQAQPAAQAKTDAQPADKKSGKKPDKGERKPKK